MQQHASIRRAVFLLQKEVGERIAASPGSLIVAGQFSFPPSVISHKSLNWRVPSSNANYIKRRAAIPQPLHIREIVLQNNSLHIVDRIFGQVQQMCSRIRIDQQALEALNNQVMVRSKPANFSAAAGRWYPLFGVGHKAKVYEVIVKAPSLLEIHWWLEWPLNK